MYLYTNNNHFLRYVNEIRWKPPIMYNYTTFSVDLFVCDIMRLIIWISVTLCNVNYDDIRSHLLCVWKKGEGAEAGVNVNDASAGYAWTFLFLKTSLEKLREALGPGEKAFDHDCRFDSWNCAVRQRRSSTVASGFTELLFTTCVEV